MFLYCDNELESIIPIMRRKMNRLPLDYLRLYENIDIDIRDKNFIRGCLKAQQNMPQLSNVQFEAIRNIEIRYNIKR